VRSALVGAAGIALAGLAWMRPNLPVGVGLQWGAFPVRACDFIEAHGIRGRAFNHLNLGGYLLWRFWPDPDRLPFMDIHQAGSRLERDLYMASFNDARAWLALRDRYDIEWALLWRLRGGSDHLLDHLDADSTFALVFVDDVAAVYVRRQGRLSAVADAFAYRTLPGGQQRLAALGAAAATDTALRARFAAELRRQIASSPFSAYAHSALASLAMFESDWAEARIHLERAAAGDPAIPWLRERMAVVALEQGRPADAVRELEAERAAHPRDARLHARLGDAYRAAGDRERARRAYRRALQLDPGDDGARTGLADLDSRRAP
jgi:tetratricopeptide (TPR) repeat protein